MKKYVFFVAIMLWLSTWSAFAQNRETRNVGTFSKISFRVPGKLVLRQGTPQKVEMEGDKDLLSEIETELEGSRLIIGKKGKWSSWNWDDDDNITVYITVQNIEALNVGGSGDLIVETPIVTNDLSLNVSGSGSLRALQVNASGAVEADVSGSGDIDLKGKANSFNSDVSGSGKVNLSMSIRDEADFGVSGSGKIMASGTASSVRTAISGSGKVLAADLETNKCNVRISGSGDVEINVKNELDVNISGSGSVSYKGNPSKLNSHAAGSGKVSKM